MKPGIRHPFVLLALAALLIKLTFLFLDPVPKFFFGDSACYLYSAVTDWIPEDRSFTYGCVIRPILTLTQSLVPLLLLHLAVSTGSVLLLAFSLRKHFGVRQPVASGAALVCSVEPLQLLYERYVMTETLSLFLFAAYLLVAFTYVRRPRVLILAPLQLLGIVLVSLRVSFVPIVLVNTVFLPLVGLWLPGREQAPEPRGGATVFTAARKRFGPRLLPVPHLAVSIALAVCMHGGYKQLYSRLSGHHPGYHASEGLMLLATWAPVVLPEDFPEAGLRSRIFDTPTFDLKNRHLRNNQLFAYDGLCWRIQFALEEVEEDEDADRANDLARTTALNALGRDPLGVARLSLQSFADYFKAALVQTAIQNDLAMDEEQVVMYREFRDDTSELLELPMNPNPGDQPVTLLKRYYRAMLPWYWFLFAAPLICAAAWLPSRGIRRMLVLELFVVTSGCVAVAGFLSVFPIVRYLHPVAWLVFFPLAVLVEHLFGWFERRGGILAG